MTVTTPCKQCGKPFTPTSKVNVYHDRQCQLDARANRTKQESVKREETGFAWEILRQAPAVKVVPPKASKIQGLMKGWKTACVLPDQQFGYRRFIDDGTLDPFHDPRAIEIAEMVVEAERPDLTVLLGDINDLPTYGRFQQEPEFVAGVQPGLDRASAHIATVAEMSGMTKCMKGNHDIRIENHGINNAMASVGLRRARRHQGEYPVLTMEFMLGISEMNNVEMIGGYPSGAYYINDNLACIHGRVTGENLVKKVINTERVSVMFGHVHSYVDGIQTFNSHGKPLFIRAHSPGCLSRIDGAVPSTKSGRDPFGRPIKSWENWSQGLTVVRYQEGNGKFVFEHIPIFEGWAQHRGADFVSKKAVNDPELALSGRP